jgi:thioredoxin 1
LANYSDVVPERAEVDALPGLTLIEFSVGWCPHCLRAQPIIEATLQSNPNLRFLKLEDGPGRRLGRSFRVKLWPTFILMRDGQEIGRIVRPTNPREIDELIVA